MPLTVTITGDASGVDVALARLQGAIDQRMSAIETRLASGEQSTRQFSERSQKHIESLQKSFDGLQNTISRITGILATFGATVSIGALAKGAIETAAGFEQLDTQLKFVVSSMAEFQKARQFILQFTATTPFQLQDVSKAFIDLTRRGFEVQRTLKAVADVAAFQRFPTQAFEQIVFQLGQIADRGKLVGQELNDLSKAGVPINRVREELALLGVTLKDDVGASAVSAKVAIEAIVQVLEKDFRDATLATAGNWKTLTSNLADMWNVFQDTIVRGPLLDFLKGIVSLLMTDMAKAIDEDQAMFASWGVTAVNAISQIALGLAQLIDLFNLVLSAGSELQAQVAALERAGGEMVGNIGASIKAFLGFSKTAQSVQEDVGQAGQAVADAISSKSPITAAVRQYLDRAKEETARLGTVADKIIADAQARNAQRTQKLADTVGGTSNEGAKAAANAAKAQEQIIEQSLKRQEALIAQSFDERRALEDASFSEQVRAAPGEAEEIGKARIAAMRLIAQEEATMLESVRLESNDKLLAATVDQLTKEKAAHAGQVADIAKIEGSLQAAYEEHGARQEAIFAKTAAVRQQLSKQATDEEIKDIIRANDILEKSREQGLEDFAKQTRQIQEEMAREQDRIQTSQLRGYENFINRIAGMLNDIFTGLLDGTLNAVNFFKRLLIAQLANIASAVITPFVASIAASVSGMLSSMLPSALGAVLGRGVFGPAGAPAGGLQSLVGGAGLVNTLMGPQSLFGGALDFLTKSLLDMGTTISQLFGGPILGQLPPGVTMQGVANVNPLMALGGLAGIGGGIFAAMNAKNIGGMAGGAIGAAGGAVALASALGLVLTPVLGPIGLALAALAPLLGNFLGGLSAPAGPRFALGGLGGVGIGTGPGGLQLTGGVTSRIGRSERLPSGVNTAAIQDALTTSVTNMLTGMVHAINEVAIDPAALLEPTQKALDDALKGALTINSSSAKNFQKDMEEQLKFVGTQVASFFLHPLNEAFRQLETASLDEQLKRLPETTAGMVQVFKAMNDQLAELSKVANTDVLRQLSSVRSRVEDFGASLADTVRVISESIVNRISDELIAQANVLLDRPLSVQITSFATLMNQSLEALSALTSAQRSLASVGLETGGIAGQIEILTKTMIETAATVSTRIVSQALSGLSADLAQVTAQAVGVQATTVNTLFSESMAALATLQQAWNAMNAVGLDTHRIQEQFSRLVSGILTTAFTVLRQSFTQGSFPEFLAVLTSIPDAVANLNPALAQLKQLGTAFAQVVGPIDQAIMELEDGLRTAGERVTFTAGQIADLRGAIADAGHSADQALPLYAKLAQALQANAAAQIAQANDVADAQIKAANESADAQVKAIQVAADAQLKSINDVADAQLKTINDAAEAYTNAVNDAFDAAQKQLSDWVTAMTDAVNTWADMAQTTAGQLRDVNATLLAEQSPAAQRQALLQQEATLAAVAFGGGAGAQQAMSELIAVEKALLANAKQTDDLKLQKDSIDKLTRLQKLLSDQLVALTGQSDPILAQIVISETQKEYLKSIAEFNTKYGDYLTSVQAVYLKVIADEAARQTAVVEDSRTAQIAAEEISRDAQILAVNLARDAQIKAIEDSRDAQITAIKVDLINQLKTLEAAMREIFASQPVVRVIGAQRGGLVGLASGEYYAQGGLVPAMLEPRERVFFPPVPAGVAAMNRAIPRFGGGGFTVPGGGSGDTVPMMLPRGSFVMNRRASGALGYQGGGMVTGGGMPVVNIHIAKLEVRNDQDIRAIIDGITKQLRREWRSPNGGGPFR